MDGIVAHNTYLDCHGNTWSEVNAGNFGNFNLQNLH